MLIGKADQPFVAQRVQMLPHRHRSDAEPPRDLRRGLWSLALELKQDPFR